MPDYLEYHKSLANEPDAIKDRIGYLIEHRVTIGEFKEAALRAVLRRHLPSTMIVGKGFIVSEHETSSQIDLLIADGGMPTLFRDGDLMIVTPDCACSDRSRAASKTTREIEQCATKLAKIGAICHKDRNRKSEDRDRKLKDKNRKPWLGIFSYDEGLQDNETFLDAALEFAYRDTNQVIDCLADGKNRFVRFWKQGK